MIKQNCEDNVITTVNKKKLKEKKESKRGVLAYTLSTVSKLTESSPITAPLLVPSLNDSSPKPVVEIAATA